MSAKRIAIIGSGVSGLVAAHLLHRRHEIVLFEAAGHVGGHVHTHAVDVGEQTFAVDTGFIVFNLRNYPNFVELLKQLDVPSDSTSMSFAVRCERTAFEYCGNSLNSFFAQRRNILRPDHYRLLAEILRFNRSAVSLVEESPEATLGELVVAAKFSDRFVDRYLVPIGASVWSTDPKRMLEFPARFLVRFFDRHGMLEHQEQPDWRVVRGGSARYVDALKRPFHSKIRLSTAVRAVRRNEEDVSVLTQQGGEERFDQVVLATHADQSLRLLEDATALEREILGCFPYQANETVLHTDSKMLPRRSLARASWNYSIPADPQEGVATTYWMNRLQGLAAPVDFCTTLNSTAMIDPDKVLARMNYEHPLYTQDSIAAQTRHAEISGPNRTHFCGAYWGSGFHEDGVRSALEVGAAFGESL